MGAGQVDLDHLRENSVRTWQNIYFIGSRSPREYRRLCDELGADPRCTLSLDPGTHPLDDLRLAANVFTMRVGPSDERYVASSSSSIPFLSDFAAEVGCCMALDGARRMDIVGSRCRRLLQQHKSTIRDAMNSMPAELSGPGYDLLDPRLRRNLAHYRLVMIGGAIQPLADRYALPDVLKAIDSASIYPVKTVPDEPAFLALKRLLD